MRNATRVSRRTWLRTTAVAGSSSMTARGHQTTPSTWQGLVGVTTGSFMKHLSVEPAAGRLRVEFRLSRSVVS
jgi:hypothetical protein